MTTELKRINLVEVNIDGSNDPLKPTNTQATESGLRISGEISAGDPDYFYIDIPDDMVLEGIWLERYVSVDPIAFYALQSGSAFTAGLDIEKMFTWSHLNRLEVGKNLLGKLPLDSLDDFVFWIQQTGAPTEYSVIITFEPTPGRVTLGTGTNELFRGSDASEVINAEGGDDTISSSLRNDTINGGLGQDTVIYASGYDKYTVTKTWDGSVGVSYRGENNISLPPAITEGDDTLINIERLKFADISLAFESDKHANDMARLIITLFGKEGLHNRELAGAAIYLADQGYSNREIASIAIPTLIEDNSNELFVKKIWINLTGNEPATSILSELVSVIDRGPDRGGLSREDLVLAAANLEWTGLQLEFIGLWNTGLLYEPWNG